MIKNKLHYVLQNGNFLKLNQRKTNYSSKFGSSMRKSKTYKATTKDAEKRKRISFVKTCMFVIAYSDDDDDKGREKYGATKE